MRKLILCLALLMVLCMPVSALEITAPEVPAAGAQIMPQQTQSFADAVLEILGDAVSLLRPDLKEAAVSCFGVLAVVVALSVLTSFPGGHGKITEFVGVLVVGGLLLGPADSLISLAADTVEQLSEYGKLLLPVMTAALAAQGGVTSSAALYTGTAVFDALLSGLISGALVPVIYLYLALALGCCALEDSALQKMRDGIKGAATWCLKTVLYVYTGYITITGAVSGTADAGALKAAKLTISGVVPVIGGILSDASEAVLVSAGTVKNAAGIYGMLAILAVWIGPFLRIGSHYLILKALSTICSVFEMKSVTRLVEDFSAAMGLLLAMTGAVCLMLMISTICFMKGVGG